MEFWSFQDISIFAFPVNLIAGLFLITGIWILHRYYRHTLIVRWLTGMSATLLSSGLLILLLLVEGIWAIQLFRTWIFILLLFLLILILGLVILKKVTSFSGRNFLFLLNHGGLWLALTAALLGAADREEYKMIVPLHQTEYNAIDREGQLHPLPFRVRLEKFELEYYSQTGNAKIPKRFCSTLTLQSRDETIRTTVEVNQPAHYKGYALYQDGYDPVKGPASQYTLLLVVRDPWLGIVYTGIFLLLAGAVISIFYRPAQKTAYDME